MNPEYIIPVILSGNILRHFPVLAPVAELPINFSFVSAPLSIKDVEAAKLPLPTTEQLALGLFPMTMPLICEQEPFGVVDMTVAGKKTCFGQGCHVLFNGYIDMFVMASTDRGLRVLLCMIG